PYSRPFLNAILPNDFFELSFFSPSSTMPKKSRTAIMGLNLAVRPSIRSFRSISCCFCCVFNRRISARNSSILVIFFIVLFSFKEVFDKEIGKRAFDKIVFHQPNDQSQDEVESGYNKKPPGGASNPCCN